MPNYNKAHQKPMSHLLQIGFGVAAIVLICSCQPQKNMPVAEPNIFVAQANVVDLSMSAVPQDIERNTPSDDELAKLAAFAWQELISMSWKSSYATNKKRGTPDTSWSYADGDPDLVVWETYAHKTELRPNGPLTRSFDAPPLYSYGTPPTQAPGTNASFTLFNNLDEDNEIGSCDVFIGSDPSVNLVVYQAKVNRDEYDYIKSTFGADQYIPKTGKLAKATANNLKNIQTNLSYFAKGNNNTCVTPPGQNGVTLPCGAIGGAEGAIEIKTAFMKVPSGQEAQYKNFFTRKAIYYTYNNGTYFYENGTFALLAIHIIHKTTNYPDFIFASFEHNDLPTMDFRYILLAPLPFEYPPAKFNAHNAKDPKFPKSSPTGTQLGNVQKIVRQSGNTPQSNGQLYPIPPQLSAVNKQVWAQLDTLPKGSIWRNYRLIGVQGPITESWAATPTTNAGPNHFMANHVVESDAFLGNFFGPGFTASKKQTLPGRPLDPSGPETMGYLNRDNILYQSKAFNTGGCKGCHGAAQTALGTDFSFLLDSGAGKPTKDPDSIKYHAP